MGKKPLIVAHRGASRHATENTLAAFDLAVAQGADLVELDVCLTKDDYLVVRNRTVIQVGHQEVNVRDLALSDLQSLIDEKERANLHTLDQVLAWARGRKAKLLIDLKSVPLLRSEPHIETLKMLESYRMTNSVLVMSFDHQCIHELKRVVGTTVKVGIIYVARLANLAQTIRTLAADFIECHNDYLTEDVVAEAHGAGAMVCSWTTNEPGEMERLAEMSVDMITTDLPDLARSVLYDKPPGRYS